MTARLLDYRDHRRQLDDNRHVYAVVSRRSQGLSIGLNLNADKVCNFDCPYCQVDRSTPGGPQRVDLDRLERELDHVLGLATSGALWSVPPFDTAAPALRVVRDIAWAGDGEPTSAAAFPETIERVGRLRAAHGLDGRQGPAVKLHLLSNATLFHRPAVAQALDRFTELGGVVWGKLDAGTEGSFHLVNGTTLPFRRVLDNLSMAAGRWNLVLQCMFMTWQGEGPADAEVAAWAARIAEIREAGPIQEVQVYSVARVPADPRVGVVPVARLEEVAAAARAVGVPVSVYPGLG